MEHTVNNPFSRRTSQKYAEAAANSFPSNSFSTRSFPARALASPAVYKEQPEVFAYSDFWQHDRPMLDTLVDLYGNRQLDSFGGSYGWSVRYRQVEDYEALAISTLREYIDAFKQQSHALPYLRHLSLNRAMPELKQHIRLPEQFQNNWADHPRLDRFSGPELFIGQAGTSFGHLHQDQVCVHIGFVQLEGEKEFVLFPPEDGKYLSTFEGREFPYQQRNSKLRYHDINDTDAFPLLAKTSPQRIRLRAGQALFVPADWWHTTYNHTDSISFSIRIINRSNFTRSLTEHCKGIPRTITRAFRKMINA